MQYNKKILINYNMLSELDKQFFKKELNILPNNVEKWTKEEFSRLLALLKLPQNIQKQFYGQCLDVKGAEDIIQKICSTISDINYFPFQKLRCAFNIIINFTEQQSMQCSLLSKNIVETSSEISIQESIVLNLMSGIDKLEDTQIIQLTCLQVFNLTKNCGLAEHATLVKKFNIDGFNLICSLSDFQILKDIRNYFKDQQIAKILQLSYLFITQYFRKLMTQQSKIKSMNMRKKNITQVEQSVKAKGQVKQYVISSNEMIKKLSEDDIQIDPLEMEQSSYGQSAIGQSQMGESQQAISERGSVYANSELAFSVRGSVDCRMSYRLPNSDGRASMMYDSQIISQLRDACMSLPFDLLNLQPLQQIKIRALKTAFGKQQDKDFWIFSVQGAKLGRDKQNDLRFPDELSISSKHAQIMFKSQLFHLQDLGSKMGTYLRIMKNIAIQDQMCIQFSTDVQIVFRILRKAPNEGIIKAEIKKPQNLPDYRISLRQGFKIKIGKSDRCHIRINNSSLAEKHSEIYYKDCAFFFKNCHASCVSWLRLSPKSVRSDTFKLSVGEIFRLSSKKSFLVQDITNQLAKNQNDKNQITK